MSGLDPTGGHLKDLSEFQARTTESVVRSKLVGGEALGRGIAGAGQAIGQGILEGERNRMMREQHGDRMALQQAGLRLERDKAAFAEEAFERKLESGEEEKEHRMKMDKARTDMLREKTAFEREAWGREWTESLRVTEAREVMDGRRYKQDAQVAKARLLKIQADQRLLDIKLSKTNVKLMNETLSLQNDALEQQIQKGEIDLETSEMQRDITRKQKGDMEEGLIPANAQIIKALVENQIPFEMRGNMLKLPQGVKFGDFMNVMGRGGGSPNGMPSTSTPGQIPQAQRRAMQRFYGFNEMAPTKLNAPGLNTKDDSSLHVYADWMTRGKREDVKSEIFRSLSDRQLTYRDFQYIVGYQFRQLQKASGRNVNPRQMMSDAWSLVYSDLPDMLNLYQAEKESGGGFKPPK